MDDLREAKAITVSCRQYASEIELVEFAEESRIRRDLASSRSASERRRR